MVGCNNSSDEYLSFDDFIAASISETENHLKEDSFFSEKLVLIKDNENIGNEDLLNSDVGLLINLTDQNALYSKNAYKKMYPANLTKLVTVLTTYKYGNLSDNVTISYNASHIPVTGAKLCDFQEGDIVPLETLIACLMVYSGNDAGVAIAEHVGGSVEEFVRLMNEEATRVGAVHSHFVNPHGLHDNEHYTTAYDMYLVFNELLQYTSFRNIISLSNYSADYKDKDGNIIQKAFVSSNQYHTEDEEVSAGITVIGGQSGSTSKAGNCMILLSKGSDDKDYISLILKAKSNSSVYSDMERLFALIPNNTEDTSDVSNEDTNINESNINDANINESNNSE